MDFTNNTPYEAGHFLLMDGRGAETLLVIVKGTWSISADGGLSTAEEQAQIESVPVYSGEPGKSSLIYDTDIVLLKPGTDCALIGHAWAPTAATDQMDVTFAVGPVRRQARVFGDRKWLRTGSGDVVASKSAAFEKIALTWENAFGGVDSSSPDPAEHEYCLENPVGCGLVARNSKLDLDGFSLPNIEDPVQLIEKPGQKPLSAGFGMVAPYWQPRAGYAGTYDEHWRRNIYPLPPADLDPRFFSVAAPGLCTASYLIGNEQVLVDGASKHGRLQFALPGVRPKAKVRGWQRDDDIFLQLDTVIVEPDESRLVLVWRGTLDVHGQVHEIKSVKIDED